MTKEKKELFTKADSMKLDLLPDKIKLGFMYRLADITQRKQICDDIWEETTNEIADDTDVLIKEIKEALAKV